MKKTNSRLNKRRQETLRRRFNALTELEKDFVGVLFEEFIDSKYEEDRDFEEAIDGLTESDLDRATFINAITALNRYRDKYQITQFYETEKKAEQQRSQQQQEKDARDQTQKRGRARKSQSQKNTK